MLTATHPQSLCVTFLCFPFYYMGMQKVAHSYRPKTSHVKIKHTRRVLSVGRSKDCNTRFDHRIVTTGNFSGANRALSVLPPAHCIISIRARGASVKQPFQVCGCLTQQDQYVLCIVLFYTSRHMHHAVDGACVNSSKCVSRSSITSTSILST